MSTANHLHDALASETYVRLNLEDGSHEGFIVGLSDTLVLLQAIYEWQDAGALVVRVEQVESCDVSDYQDDQVKILNFNSVKRTKRFSWVRLNGFADLFRSLQPKNRFVVVSIEDEADVGQIESIAPDHVVLKAVDPGGNWLEDEIECPYEAITSVQFDDNYSRVLQRYIEKAGALN